MGDRRPTRGTNLRAREPVRLPDPSVEEDIAAFIARSDRDDLRRLAKLLHDGAIVDRLAE